MQDAIHVEHLNKSFLVKRHGRGFANSLRFLLRPDIEEMAALTDVSMTIKPGERVAFVGPNGAGKSTTIKILAGILRPTSGQVSVFGLDPAQDRKQLAYNIGTVFGQRSQLWTHLPARDSFSLLARIYDLDLEVYRQRRDELIERFAVGNLVDKPVRQLSLGERMRCEIIASLLHSPRMLFLDEPTIGLDVTAKAIIRDIIREQSQREGSTLMLTSHDAGDMEQVCERVIMIHDGRLIIDRPVRELRSHYIKKKRVIVKTAEGQVSLDVPGVTLVEQKPHEAVFSVDVSVSPVGKVLAALVAKYELRDATIEDPPLEQIIKKIYAEGSRA